MMKLVLVDFDDTLVETAPAFHQSQGGPLSSSGGGGVPRRRHPPRFTIEEVDPELWRYIGMGPSGWHPPSGRPTCGSAREWADPDPDGSRRMRCTWAGFPGKPHVMDGSLEALERLAAASAHRPLFPGRPGGVSDGNESGMPESRRSCGEDRIRITDRKTPEAFLDALSRFGIENRPRPP